MLRLWPKAPNPKPIGVILGNIGILENELDYRDYRGHIIGVDKVVALAKSPSGCLEWPGLKSIGKL